MAEVLIARELLSDQVYDMIRTSILEGTVSPGDRLVESEIARRLSVSQAPVREAIKKLVHDGLVTSVPRNGSYVTEISQDELRIARQIRAALERVGASTAVESIDAGQLLELEAIVSRMNLAVNSGDWASFRTLDMEFHAHVLAIGGHPILTRLWAALEPLLVSQRAIGDPSYSGDKSRLVQWHVELIDALRTRDPERAGEAFFEHASGLLGPID